MPVARVNEVDLYYEVTGKGFPLVWSHEFAGSHKSWEPQVRFFSRRYRVITYNARGFPPSEVPSDPAAYSQEIAIEDLHQLLRHLGVEQAYVGGLSLGGNVALNFGIAHPDMVKALIVAATGSGSTNREAFERRVEEMARAFEAEGMKAVAGPYAKEAHRVQLLRKDPRSYQEYYGELASHSAKGAALTARGVMLKRPPISALEPKLKQLTIPTLIMVGDEDDRCIDPALFMKRNIPHSGLAVFPQSGHVINVEEPALFNQTVLDFLTSVEAGTWA